VGFGCSEGQTVVFEHTYAVEPYDRFDANAAALVARNVDVIIAVTRTGAKRATTYGVWTRASHSLAIQSALVAVAAGLADEGCPSSAPSHRSHAYGRTNRLQELIRRMSL
jgi:hypothetical protein